MRIRRHDAAVSDPQQWSGLKTIQNVGAGSKAKLAFHSQSSSLLWSPFLWANVGPGHSHRVQACHDHSSSDESSSSKHHCVFFSSENINSSFK
jgi:hypothetical protein